MLEIAHQKCFGGTQLRYQHQSSTLNCSMRFSIYLPENASPEKPVPVLYWLSGLTCNDENFVQKAGAQRYAAEYGIAIVAADTSPRGEDVADDETATDFGKGAGFYLDATQTPWASHYKMETYITTELKQLVESNFPVDGQRSGIFGHSMGGHGAITLGLKNPQLYRSISAFAPICSPINCPWGHKALQGYLGSDKRLWETYDSCSLVGKSECKTPLFIDQGEDDGFLQEQLKPELLQQACEANQHPLTLRFQPGYDHSYFFIASFIADHIAYHAKALSS
ncbi:S-formylglutathione hydrolase [Teredinibacter waterburyi]|jgi:S-formylglutathione hydrolase|uniref:S-formylglutathione hydrolase n=1 Tax=Teredinibacter waterburyi TaxID=1500538 RepID=UPI00165F6C91|nr:S-formylglutathione hydrolase [Teredinibacter waterburyi]